MIHHKHIHKCGCSKQNQSQPGTHIIMQKIHERIQPRPCGTRAESPIRVIEPNGCQFRSWHHPESSRTFSLANSYTEIAVHQATSPSLHSTSNQLCRTRSKLPHCHLIHKNGMKKSINEIKSSLRKQEVIVPKDFIAMGNGDSTAILH